MRFRRLLEALHERTGERVVVLVDEYDKPICGYTEADLDTRACTPTTTCLSAFDVASVATEALLFQTGYLTIAAEQNLACYLQYRLGYPNREVRRGLSRGLLRWRRTGARRAAASRSAAHWRPRTGPTWKRCSGSSWRASPTTSELVSGTWCNEPGREWDLLIFAVVIGMIAAFVVWLVRGRQLQRWDLRASPVAPSTTAILWTVALCAIIPTSLLSLSIYTADPCAPEQQRANVVWRWAGVVVAAAACLAGLQVAKAQYVKGSRR